MLKLNAKVINVLVNKILIKKLTKWRLCDHLKFKLKLSEIDDAIYNEKLPFKVNGHKTALQMNLIHL